MNPYGKELKLLGDWNALLAGGGGCCEMPECPSPSIKGQNASAVFCGESLPDHPGVESGERCAVYKTVKHEVIYTWDHNYVTIDGAPTESTNSYSGSDASEYIANWASSGAGCSVTSWSKKNVVASENIYLATSFGAYSHTEKTTESYTTTQTNSTVVVTTGSITTQRYDFASGEPDEDPVTETDFTVAPTAAGFLVDGSFDRMSDLVFEKTVPYFYESEEGVDPAWTESGSRLYRVTYSNPVVASDALAGVDFSEDENNTAVSFYAELACGSARKFRFRFKVPTNHTGNWFEFVYDIIEEPDGWDATIPDPENPEGPEIPDPAAPDRTFSEANESIIWEVTPGEIPLIDDPNVEPPDPLPFGWEHPQIRDPDSDLWYTDWVTVQPPDAPGIRRVVNIRFRCYRGPFGSLPQTLGEQVTLEEPTP